MSGFYMTYARSRPDDIVPYAEEHGIGLMTNAAHRWSDATDRFLELWQYDCPHIVDSGGYNVQSQWARQFLSSAEVADAHNPNTDRTMRYYIQLAVKRAGPLHHRQRLGRSPFYPWAVEEYHEWLEDTYRENRFEWAACMDYACERTFDAMWSVEDRVDATVENTIRQFELDPSYPLTAVLQGRSVEKYVECYDRLVDHGVPVEHVGLGTVCRISSSKAIVETERAVRDRCPKIETMHGFGVKVNAFKHGATFDTADSQAWVYKPSNGAVVHDGFDRLIETPEDDSLTRTVESFKHYHAYADRLKTKANGGGQLKLPAGAWT